MGLTLSPSTVLLLCLFLQSSYCQQVPLNNTVSDWSNNPSTPKAYLCNGPQKPCTSILIFRSKPPYNNPVSIAYLLGSEASAIASINKISNNDTIPSNHSIIVPIYCSCSGNIYQHSTPYTVRKADTYYDIVRETYQGLTTCQALMGENYYPPDDIPVGLELMVPVICACPTANQTANGVTSLLVYSLEYDDTFESIRWGYGVNEQSMREANGLPPVANTSISIRIYPFTPILVPLKGKSCKEKENTESFYCNHAQGSLVYGNFTCDEPHRPKYPAKLVASIVIVFLLSPPPFQ